MNGGSGKEESALTFLSSVWRVDGEQHSEIYKNKFKAIDCLQVASSGPLVRPR